jgi:hypothetical protein
VALTEQSTGKFVRTARWRLHELSESYRTVWLDHPSRAQVGAGKSMRPLGAARVFTRIQPAGAFVAST